MHENRRTLRAGKKHSCLASAGWSTKLGTNNLRQHRLKNKTVSRGSTCWSCFNVYLHIIKEVQTRLPYINIKHLRKIILPVIFNFI